MPKAQLQYNPDTENWFWPI